MLRRDFLKGVAFTALAAGLLKRIPLGAAVKKDEKCDLAAVRGGSPGDMFDLAIAELGGMGAVVRKGQNNAISSFKSKAKSAEKAIKKINTQLSNLESQAK